MKFIAMTSTMSDGNMALRYGPETEVLANRKQFILKCGFDPNFTLVMHSDHSDRVTMIDALAPQNAIGYNKQLPADTLITQDTRYNVLLSTADCLPISLLDEQSQTFGLMHLSRHTYMQGLIEKSFATLNDKFAVRADQLSIWIGPHIHRASYCFSLPLKKEYPELDPYLYKTETHACLDLTQAAINALLREGVRESRLTVSPVDTYASPEHFSHVASAQKNQPEGRLATVVGFVERDS